MSGGGGLSLDIYNRVVNNPVIQVGGAVGWSSLPSDPAAG